MNNIRQIRREEILILILNKTVKALEIIKT